MIDPKRARAIKKAADQARAATEERNRQIAAAHHDGASLREIAEHAGITHVAVKKIVERSKE